MNKIRRTANGGIPAIASVEAARSTGVTTLTVDTQQFWPTIGDVDFSTYKVDANGKRIAGSQTDWKATSNGTNALSGLVRTGGAADTGNAVGDKVQMGPTAQWAEDLVEGLADQHNLTDGSHGAITATGYTQASGTFSVPNGVIAPAALQTHVKMGTLTTPASTGNQSITGVGFKPQLVRFTYLPSITTSSSSGGHGAMTVLAQYSSSWTYATSVASRYSDTTHAIAINTTGSTTPISSASFVSMDSDGFTINFDNATAGLTVAWEAWG